jgi:hypothetical protein
MSVTAPPVVTPRREGDPEVDLTAYRLVHRAMLTDVAALADLADRVAGGSSVLGPERAAALARYAGRLCAEIGALLAAECDEVWPVVAASAGSAMDLADLRDDHRAIGPALTRCRSAADAIGVVPDDPETACALATAATDLLGLLQEHVAEEERELFPVVRRFVSTADFGAAVCRVRRDAGARRLAWLLPWVAHHATPVEVDVALAGCGGRTRLLLAASSPRFARGRRAALG